MLIDAALIVGLGLAVGWAARRSRWPASVGLVLLGQAPLTESLATLRDIRAQPRSESIPIVVLTDESLSSEALRTLDQWSDEIVFWGPELGARLTEVLDRFFVPVAG